jgi:hypothetical protein
MKAFLIVLGIIWILSECIYASKPYLEDYDIIFPMNNKGKICTRCKRPFGGPNAPDMCQACRLAVENGR